MAKQMTVMTISVDIVEADGRSLFPLEDPIPWEILINDKAAEVLTTWPSVLESMIDGIRAVVSLHK